MSTTSIELGLTFYFFPLVAFAFGDLLELFEIQPSIKDVLLFSSFHYVSGMSLASPSCNLTRQTPVYLIKIESDTLLAWFIFPVRFVGIVLE
jgi:hypothetical protein